MRGIPQLIQYESVQFVLQNLSFSDEEVEKVHLPYFYYKLCLKLEKSPVSQIVSLVKLVNELMSDLVFTTTWSLLEFRDISPVSANTDRSPKLTAAWVINEEDIMKMYNSPDPKLLQQLDVGSNSILAAFDAIQTFMVKRQSADSFIIMCNVIMRHLKLGNLSSPMLLKSIKETIKQCSFDIFEAGAMVLTIISKDLPNGVFDGVYHILNTVLVLLLKCIRTNS